MQFDSNLKSWVEVDKNNEFPIQNIPFGIAKTKDNPHFAASIIGDYIINLAACNNLGLFEKIELPKAIFSNRYLNDYIALGKETTNKVRTRIINFMKIDGGGEKYKNEILIPVNKVELLLPVKIGDYTDFYSSIEHATNVGCLFRDPENALMPNWRHLPVGYHGRSSSIIVSGTDIHRPKGQSRPDPTKDPIYGPCRLMDFELEMGFIIGKATEIGDQVKINTAEEHMFGLILFNDWSARDIQGWEYVPLGPFLGKNFASTVSPWIVTMEALEPFKIAGPEQKPAVLPYLQSSGLNNYDINLSVEILPENGQGKIVSESNFKYMYWNMCQQLAHHTVNGCNINVGDMYASGTISGPTPDSYGSMLEISWKGTKPIDMPDGSQRKFINDGDTVVMRGYAMKDGIRIGMGKVTGKILPSK